MFLHKEHGDAKCVGPVKDFSIGHLVFPGHTQDPLQATDVVARSLEFESASGRVSRFLSHTAVWKDIALYTAALVEVVRFLFWKTLELSLPKAAEARPMRTWMSSSMLQEGDRMLPR